MKVKHFDKVQTYLLDAIWQRVQEGRDVPATLVEYANYVDSGNPESMSDVMVERLHQKLREFQPVDPSHGKWRTWGFAVPFHGQPEDIYIANPLEIQGSYEQALVVNVPGTEALVLCVEKREKVLPSSAINDKVFERAQAMKEREQRDLNRKDYAIIKEEVTASMLNTAPVRRVRTYLMLDRGDLHVFTGSQKAAEECTALLRSALSSLPTVPAFKGEVVVQQLFKEILMTNKTGFDAGSYIKLKNSESKEVVTFKDGELAGDDRVVDLLDSMFDALEMEFSFLSKSNMRTWVKMNHKADIKYLATQEDDDRSNEFHEQYEVGEGGYQSKMAELWVLVKVLRDLHAAFREAGIMVDRAGNDVFEETGDELDQAFQEAMKNVAGVEVAEDEADQEDDDGAFEDEEEQQEDGEDDEWEV